MKWQNNGKKNNVPAVNDELSKTSKKFVMNNIKVFFRITEENQVLYE
jgi:hypothetical protein